MTHRNRQNRRPPESGMADPPGPTGDCSHLHCRPVVENRIDTLVRQLSNSGIRPAAAETHESAMRPLAPWRNVSAG